MFSFSPIVCSLEILYNLLSVLTLKYKIVMAKPKEKNNKANAKNVYEYFTLYFMDSFCWSVPHSLWFYIFLYNIYTKDNEHI